ncbi:MAG: coproporphyrinogen III oxidase, partial [Pararhodobacter sp.]|nr:coproporphyrinogen III oxidase [Pararhodobacter sp.]
MTDTATDTRKQRASDWFRSLRDTITARFEALEDSTAGPGPAGRFEVTPTTRDGGPDGRNGGGGIMSVMRGGRLFEKVGVNWSAVHGTLGARAQAAMAARGVPGMAEDPRFWASGISLVAHMRNPHCPAVHMNTRMFWTPGAWWFGGGADLNPCLEYPEDTAHFHAVMQRACDAHDPAYYDRFKAWADEYFHVPHRGRARGVGGIFYDDLNSGGPDSDSWDADFAFTRAVGEAFLPAFAPL